MNQPPASPRFFWPRVLLAAGDLAILVYFAAQGRATHQLLGGRAPVLGVLLTAAPFVVAWFVVAPLVGVYRSEVVRQPAAAVGRTALAWLVAGSLGLILRALMLGHVTIVVVFALITLGLNLVLLTAWHGALALLLAGRRGSR